MRTTGGNFQACEAALRIQAGLDVEFAVCVGRTVSEQESDRFRIVEALYDPPR